MPYDVRTAAVPHHEKEDPAHTTKYRGALITARRQPGLRGIDRPIRSHHAHGPPEQLICSFLLIVAKRCIERLERFVHCAHGIKLHCH